MTNYLPDYDYNDMTTIEEEKKRDSITFKVEKLDSIPPHILDVTKVNNMTTDDTNNDNTETKPGDQV